MQRYSIDYFAHHYEYRRRAFFPSLRHGQSCAIVAIIVPLAIIDNAFRIVGLSLLANYVNTSFLLDGRLHDLGGYFLFVLSITILIVLISLLRRFEQRPQSLCTCAR